MERLYEMIEYAWLLYRRAVRILLWDIVPFLVVIYAICVVIVFLRGAG
jgi:hypothetical protein